MKIICSQCQKEMVTGFDLKVDGAAYGVSIKKKVKGLFSNKYTAPKAAICPDCGSVSFYIENPKNFIED